MLERERQKSRSRALVQTGEQLESRLLLTAFRLDDSQLVYGNVREEISPNGQYAVYFADPQEFRKDDLLLELAQPSGTHPKRAGMIVHALQEPFLVGFRRMLTSVGNQYNDGRRFQRIMGFGESCMIFA